MPGPKKGDPNKALTGRQELFCREYLIDLCATKAAIRAGYSPKHAAVTAHDLLRNPPVAARIAALQAERISRTQINADAVLERLWLTATADPASITRHHIGSCRYCWGVDHEYQWRTPREYRDACDAAAERDKTMPLDAGGYGFDATRAPNPACPECNGLGVQYTRFADTANMTAQERMLFQGVKETREGLEFKLADRMKALEMVGRHLGMFKDVQEVSGKNGGPIEHTMTAKVVLVPAKQGVTAETRSMPPDPDGDA